MNPMRVVYCISERGTHNPSALHKCPDISLSEHYVGLSESEHVRAEYGLLHRYQFVPGLTLYDR